MKIQEKIFTKHEIYKILYTFQLNESNIDVDFDDLPEETKETLTNSYNIIINTVLEKENKLLRLTDIIKALHFHDFYISTKNDGHVNVVFQNANEDYEDYVIRTLSEVYGYECHNNIEGGIYVKLK